jgi:Ca2+-binding EF-hand superfamily protein
MRVPVGAGTVDMKAKFKKKFIPPTPSLSPLKEKQEPSASTSTTQRRLKQPPSHSKSNQENTSTPQTVAVQMLQHKLSHKMGHQMSLRGAFENFERQAKSNDKLVDFDEFRRACNKFDIGFPENTLALAFQELDKDGSGCIDMSEFVKGILDETSQQHKNYRTNLFKNQRHHREIRATVAASAVQQSRDHAMKIRQQKMEVSKKSRAQGATISSSMKTHPRSLTPAVPIERSKYHIMIDKHRLQSSTTRTSLDMKKIKQVVQKLADKATFKFKSISDMFNKFDINRDGCLSYHDFNDALKRYDFDRFIKPQEAYAVFSSLDVNKDDRVSHREFMQVFNNSLPVSESQLSTSIMPKQPERIKGKPMSMSPKERSMINKARLSRIKNKLHQRITDMATADSLNNRRESQTLLQAFRKFDKDIDGDINLKELVEVNNRLNLGLKKNELALVFNEMDKDGSGSIDVREFIRTLRSEDYDKSYNPFLIGRQRMIGVLQEQAKIDITSAAEDLGAYRAKRWSTDTHHVLAANMEDPSHPLSMGYGKQKFKLWKQEKLGLEASRPSTTSSINSNVSSSSSATGRLNFRAYLQEKNKTRARSKVTLSCQEF